MTHARPAMHLDRIRTPLGELVFVADDEGVLRVVGFSEGHEKMQRHLESATSGASLNETHDPFGLRARFEAYFGGELSALDRLAVAPTGTGFQRDVWSELRRIPCGTTISYQELARRIGNVKAVRAVGLANGANPLSVIVPCHRVIGANRKLTGYAGGLERKRWLLDHEGAAQNTESFVFSTKSSSARMPATELPVGPSPGANTQSVSRSGITARMPPPTPLLHGRPMR